MEGDDVGTDSQEEITVVMKRGEEKLKAWGNTIGDDERREEAGEKDDDNESQVEQNCETQICSHSVIWIHDFCPSRLLLLSFVLMASVFCAYGPCLWRL